MNSDSEVRIPEQQYRRLLELEPLLREAHGLLVMVQKARPGILVNDFLKRATKVLSEANPH